MELKKQPQSRQGVATEKAFSNLAVLTGTYHSKGGKVIEKQVPAKTYYDAIRSIARNFNAANDGNVRVLLPDFYFSGKIYPYNKEIFAVVFSAALHSAQINCNDRDVPITVRAAEYDFVEMYPLLDSKRKTRGATPGEDKGCLPISISPPIHQDHADAIIKGALPILNMHYPFDNEMAVCAALAQTGCWEFDTKRAAMSESRTTLAIHKITRHYMRHNGLPGNVIEEPAQTEPYI